MHGHRRTASREPLTAQEAEESQTAEPSEEPELLDILSRVVPPPVVLEGVVVQSCHAQSARTSDASPHHCVDVVQLPSPTTTTFEKRLPRFLCGACACCGAALLLIVVLLRAASGDAGLDFGGPEAP